MAIISALLIGLLFGLGILVSGMGNPAKVLNFFDFAGQWDPSLAFVMGGALLTTGLGYQIVLRRSGPLHTARFELPTVSPITPRLILGAALFGIGWGITGFCPGGLVPVIGLGKPGPVIFFAGLIVGLIGARTIQTRIARDKVFTQTSNDPN